MYGRRKQENDEPLDEYGLAMSFDPVRTPEQELIERDDIGILLAELERLPARIERVIRMHFGIGCEPHTFEAIAVKFNCTRERIRQIEAKGWRRLALRLRKKLRPEHYWVQRMEELRRLREDQAYWTERAEAEHQQYLERKKEEAEYWRQQELFEEQDRLRRQQRTAQTWTPPGITDEDVVEIARAVRQPPKPLPPPEDYSAIVDRVREMKPIWNRLDWMINAYELAMTTIDTGR